MRKLEFRTVSEELLSCARAAHAHFKSSGYKVRIEVGELGAPFTPTLTAVRGVTTLHVDVANGVSMDRVAEWVAYGKSTGSDTRLAFCVPGTSEVVGLHETGLRSAKVGLYTLEGGAIVERVPPFDLALGVELPNLKTKKAMVRMLLGPAYEQFNCGQWREGFEDACKALEDESRRYLKRWSKGRITIQTKKGPTKLQSREIDSMTMGQLAKAFAQILVPTQLDSIVGQALAKLVHDRNRITHHKRKKVTERNLRNNVGRHMWAIVNVLDQMRSS